MASSKNKNSSAKSTEKTIRLRKKLSQVLPHGASLKEEKPVARIKKTRSRTIESPTDHKILQLPTIDDVKEFVRQQEKTSIISQALLAKDLDVSIDSLELPTRYDISRLALMPKDPNWLFATWDVAVADLEKTLRQMGSGAAEPKLTLRVYDVTLVDFNGSNANTSFDIDVGSANNWYINLWNDNVSICVELGLKDELNRFYPIIRSNVVRTPPKSSSWRSEEIWMEVKDHKESEPFVYAFEAHPDFDKESESLPPARQVQYKRKRRYYISRDDVRQYYLRLMPRLWDIVLARLRGSLGRRTHLTGQTVWDRQRLLKLMPRGWSRRILLGASEEMVESGEWWTEQLAASASLPVGEQQRKFFFEVWADLIVYGRTEPDAKVTLKDVPIQLKPDGTFTLRSSLPDGSFPFDFTAQSADSKEERSIFTEVRRATKILAPLMLSGKI